MKRLIPIIILLSVGYLSALAQIGGETSVATNNHVTVHVGENRLADLLTEEQQKGISRLTITGTLEQADYDFLRGERWDGLLGRIDTLDLTDADIDTIPGNAFGWGWNKICLILPKRIKTIGTGVPWALSFCIISDLVPSTGIPRNWVTSFCACTAIENMSDIAMRRRFFILSSFFVPSSSHKGQIYYI